MKDFRDPKVTWNTTNEAWVMSVVKPQEFTVCFYQSKNLIDWELLSEFSNKNGTDGVWECPDLFPLAVDDDPKNIKWVLFISVNPGGVTGGSGTQYFIGDWDGKKFTPDDRVTRWLDYGRDNYAGVTFNDAPKNRRIYLGWMSNWDYAKDIPANPHRGSMTIPRELRLATVDGKVTLHCQLPNFQNLLLMIKPSRLHLALRNLESDLQMQMENLLKSDTTPVHIKSTLIAAIVGLISRHLRYTQLPMTPKENLLRSA
jgi:sucrose-6-phosphate hydrolase SacC (GH32 family)